MKKEWKSSRKGKGKSSQKAEEVTESAGSASLQSTSSSVSDIDTHWTADSGATSHMTPHRHWIHNYESFHTPIRLTDHTIVYSEGVGSVIFNPVIEGKSVRGVEFTRVLYVPQL